jgi:hypothetical protein
MQGRTQHGLIPALVFAVILAVSCSKPAPKGEPTKGGCDDVFAPPPRGQKLCEEHVNATDSEIAWSSYALDEPRADVAHRYEGLGTRCKDAKIENGNVTVGERIVTVHDANAAGYPTCEKKPSASQKTVVVISKRTLRAP